MSRFLFALLLTLSTPLHAAERIVLQLPWDHQFQFAGFYAALWLGHYREAGLEVEIRSAFAGRRHLSVVDEVVEGRADFGVYGAGLLLARAEGKPVVLTASLFQESPSRIYFRDDRPVRTVADLKELTIGRYAWLPAYDLELRALLASEGIDLNALRTVDRPPGDTARGLAEGRYDAVQGFSLSTEWEAERLGLTLRSIGLSEFGLRFYGDSLFASERLTAERPDLAARFTQASLKGWAYALEHEAEIADRIARDLPRVAPLSGEAQELNRFQAPRVRRLMLHPTVDLGNINPQRWRAMHDQLRRIGLVSGELDVGRFVFDPARAALERAERTRNWALAGLGALLLAGLAASAWLLFRFQRDAARRSTERLLASMAANFPGVLFRRRIWPDGRIEYDFMSAGAAALFGAQPDEWRGATSVRELSQRVLPEDRAEWLEAMQRSTRELTPLDIECRVGTRDGGFRWLRTIARGWREGEAATFDGVVFDITDRKLAEERMREAEHRLAEVAANFPGAIYRRRLRADGALEYLSMSDGIVALTGAPADAYLKMGSLQDLASVIVAEDMPLWREANDRSARTLEPVDLTIRVRGPDGAIRWIRTHSRARREADGAVVWDGVVLDVSEAKRLEDALRGSERRFRALADAMPQIVWVRDPDGAAVYFNARWREFTGFDDAQSLGWRWLDALHPDDREPALAAWRRAREANEPYEAEMRYRRRDGAWRWFLVRAAPAADDGEVMRWYGAATDIEEIKRTERRQALLMAELDHRVKNTLAAVQSIAQRTLSASGEAERFAGRLGALANTHSLIAHGRWEGARLRDIVEAELAPYRAGGEARAIVAGDEVMLAPRAAQTLGLALHELATNAAKYGALSTSTGRVEVTWNVGANGSGRKLSLSWRERGGPPAAPPERRGFGLLLIERSIAYEIGGGAEIAFSPQGLECGIDVGEEALADAPVTERAGAAPSRASG